MVHSCELVSGVVVKQFDKQGSAAAARLPDHHVAAAAVASWSPATGPARPLAKHKADRAAVVRAALDAAGMLTPDVERMAANVLSPDGLPRFVWTDDKPDPTTYTPHASPGCG